MEMKIDNFKMQDRCRVLDFLEKAGGEVAVSDLIEGSGAEKLRVYALLHELVLEKQLRVVKESEWGAPEMVALNN